jgi:hypothetical protein
MYNRYNSSLNQLPYGESSELSTAIKQLDLRSHHWGTGAGGHHQRVQPLQRRSVRKTAVLGGSVVLDCDLPLEQQHPHSHQLDQHQHRENEPGQLQHDASAGAAASAAVAATLSERLPPLSSLDDVDELDPDIDDPDLTNRRRSAGHMIKWHKQGIEVRTMFPLHLLSAARRRQCSKREINVRFGAVATTRSINTILSSKLCTRLNLQQPGLPKTDEDAHFLHQRFCDSFEFLKAELTRNDYAFLCFFFNLGLSWSAYILIKIGTWARSAVTLP